METGLIRKTKDVESFHKLSFIMNYILLCQQPTFILTFTLNLSNTLIVC